MHFCHNVCCEKACSYAIHTYHIGDYRWITAARDPTCLAKVPYRPCTCCEKACSYNIHTYTLGDHRWITAARDPMSRETPYPWLPVSHPRTLAGVKCTPRARRRAGAPPTGGPLPTPCGANDSYAPLGRRRTRRCNSLARECIYGIMYIHGSLPPGHGGRVRGVRSFTSIGCPSFTTNPTIWGVQDARYARLQVAWQ